MSDFKELLNTSKKDDNEQGSGAKIQEVREVATIQAAVLMAKQCPRNQNQSYLNIIDSCKRSALAEQALYAYPRGSKLVEGPSIRLAEVIAREWGNCRVGVSILKQSKDKTEARAFAFDLETNYQIDQDFVVEHKRTTKRGTQKLTDERDIRELVSNIGSRALRGCILRLIPADIVDDAVAQVKKTMQSSDIPIGEQIKKMVTAFSDIGVKPDNIEKFLGHNLDAIVPQEVVTLKGIYKSIKDGMATREQFFDIASAKQVESVDELKNLVSKKDTKKESIK